MEETENILPKLEARMIEFLAEWSVSLLMPAQGILEARAPTSPSCSKKIIGSAKSTLALKLQHHLADRNHTLEWWMGKSGV